MAQMSDGELKLNAEYLEQIAELISRFYGMQIDILETYIRQLRTIGQDWIDENFEENILDVVQKMQSKFEDGLGDLTKRFSEYYKNRAQIIINRPKYKGCSLSGSVSDVEYSVPKKNLKSTINDIFTNTEKEIRDKIFTYLQKINFINLRGEKISFYDPYGRSKRGIYKNIMAVDINSPTFEQDLQLMTGQHIFFYLERKQQLKIIESFNNELKMKAVSNDSDFNKYVASIKSGNGLNFKYINVTDVDYKIAMTFFSQVFNDYISGTKNARSYAKKYFSNTYDRIVDVLKNLNS